MQIPFNSKTKLFISNIDQQYVIRYLHFENCTVRVRNNFAK
jgi:hypothetical protein